MVHATRLPPAFRRHLERGECRDAHAENSFVFVWISFQSDLEETRAFKKKTVSFFFLLKLLNEQTLKSLSAHWQLSVNI